MPSFFLTFAILLLATLLLPLAQTQASDTPIAFKHLETFAVSESTGQAIENTSRVVPIEYPYAVWVSLGEYLPQHFEIRAKVFLENDSDLYTPSVLSLYLPATFEIFWEDQLLGTNGKLAQDGSEQEVGQSHTPFSIPTPLETGKLYNLRIRGLHTHDADSNHALILSLQSLSKTLSKSRTTAIIYSLYIGFALFGIYLLAYYYFKRDHPQYLLLGATCLLFGLYAVNKLVYYEINVRYTYLDWIGIVANSINNTLSVIGPATLLFILGCRKRLLFAVALTPFIAAKSLDTLEVVPAAAYLCSLISLAAIFVRRPHAIRSLIVSVTLLATYEYPFLRENQAIGFGALLAFLLISIIQILSAENRARNEAELRNTRLKLELLKSKIQPHFVLNSLTSAIEWIETNPKEGTKLIAELAREFDLLSNIAEERLIPIATEIQSCRTYLRIMEYRKKAHYELQLIDVNEQENLPPSVLRNLIENALTHNAYGQGSFVFKLQESREHNHRQFRFTAPYLGDSSQSPADGTGIKYIKARLNESYDNWTFSHGPENGNWVTTLTVPTQSRI